MTQTGLTALLAASPIAGPLACVVLTMMLGRWGRVQRAVSALGSAGQVWAAWALLRTVDGTEGGVLALQVGDWPAPFGISLVVDRLGAVMVALTAGMGLAAQVYAWREEDPGPRSPFFAPLLHGLLLGLGGAFTTGDLFNLYVWFEVLLMASFALLTLGGTRARLRGGVVYVLLNLLGSLLFLGATGLLFGLTGTLNFADIRRVLEENPSPLTAVVAMLFVAAFGLKAGVAPLFFWLPASYHTPAFAVSGLFAALLTKVGVVALVRAFVQVFPADGAFVGPLLTGVACASMAVGVLGAASQQDLRRILAFHSVSQIGYILLGVSLGTPAGLAAAVVFTIHHAIVKSNLFLIAGLFQHACGASDLRDERLRGMLRRTPAVAALFLLMGLALAGAPPLSGFPAKLGVLRACVDAHALAAGLTALLVGVLTLYSMIKIWDGACWRTPPAPAGSGEREWDPDQRPLPPARRPPWTMLVPVMLLAAGAVALGVLAGPVHEFALRASGTLLEGGPTP